MNGRGVARASRGLRASVLVCAVSAVGCAGRTPAPHEPAIIAGSVCSGLRGLSEASFGDAVAVRRGPEVAAVISEPTNASASPELAVVELASARLLWRKPVRAGSRPQILEDLVVTTEDRHLVAYDLASGAERFRRELDRPFWIGAAQSGATVVITTGAASWDPKQRGSSLIALDARSGARRWSREVPYALTRPALLRGRVLVVADRADLWALDLETGDDTGCSAIGGNTVEWLESDGASVRFGASDVRQLGADGRALASRLELPRRDLPGRPFPRQSSYQPQPAERSAHGRVAVIAPLHTTPHGPRLSRDGFYFVFYRDVFAFDSDGRLAWVQLLDADVARAQASPAGLWIVTEAGELALLSRDTGEARTRRALGLRVASADFLTDVAREAPSEPPAASADPPPPAAELQGPLERLAQDTDARMLPARMLAVDELARIETSSATRDLLEIYEAPNAPRGLRDRIERLLRARKLGTEFLVEALARHEDFLEEVRGAPLRAIVPGLVAQRETRAVPALVEHLFDPDTAQPDLSLLVTAIDALGGASAREPLLRFFAMYRADSALRDDPDPLVQAAAALMARDDAESRAVLEATRDSELTAQPLREQLEALLRPPPEPVPEAVAETAVVATAPEPAAASVNLRAVLDGARPAFEPCLQAAQARTPKLTAVRVRFVAHPDGVARAVHAMPNDPDLTRCLAAKLAELRLPSERKQLVSYGFAVLPAVTPALRPDSRAQEPTTFWADAEKRAPKLAPAPKSPPWWQDKNPLFVSIDAPARPTPLLPAKSTGAPAAPRPKPATAPAVPPAATDAWWDPVQPAKP